MSQHEANDRRAARRERIRAERAAAWAEHEATPETPEPEYEDHEGLAHQLRAGDRVMSIGGTTGHRSFKRYSFGDAGDKVLDAGQTPRQRTRGHLVLETYGHFVLRSDYPVRYRRPVDTTDTTGSDQ